MWASAEKIPTLYNSKAAGKHKNWVTFVSKVKSFKWFHHPEQIELREKYFVNFLNWRKEEREKKSAKKNENKKKKMMERIKYLDTIFHIFYLFRVSSSGRRSKGSRRASGQQQDLTLGRKRKWIKHCQRSVEIIFHCVQPGRGRPSEYFTNEKWRRFPASRIVSKKLVGQRLCVPRWEKKTIVIGDKCGQQAWRRHWLLLPFWLWQMSL